MDVQLKKAVDQVEDEHYSIMFFYKVYRQKYGKLIEQMKHNVLKKRIYSQRQ